jgi:hypothetical protein
MWRLPQKGFSKRMRVYFREMFPLPARLGSAALLYASFTALLARIHGLRPALASPFALLGVWNIFALLLILRLMDELKDKEIDRVLFKERPLPSGRVRDTDITTGLAAVCLLFLGANVCTRWTFLAAAAVLAYAFLMFKYFFAPEYLRAHLLPNLATHNPIVALLLFQTVILYSVQAGLGWKDVRWPAVLAAVAMNWAMFFSWEIGRKIRSREEENAYVTYSRIFGRAGAVAVAAGAQTAAVLLGLYLFHEFSLAPAALGLMVLGYIVTLSALLRFLLKPGPATSKLRPFAEVSIVCFLASVLAGGLAGGRP